MPDLKPCPICGSARIARFRTAGKVRMPDLKPCPICGSARIAISRPQLDSCLVDCGDCGAESSDVGETAGAAAALWNRRAGAPAVDRDALVALLDEVVVIRTAVDAASEIRAEADERIAALAGRLDALLNP